MSMSFMTQPIAEKPDKTERLGARFEPGIAARIDRVLYGGEVRSAFFRAAIEAELRRRERDAGISMIVD